MTRPVAAALLVLGACAWSNSLYEARRLSDSAARAEREERNFDAGSLWGQAAVKADSAYARDPDGNHGAEALWLRGRALAHLGDCPSALPVLERAQVVAGVAEWSAELRIELARCRSLQGDPVGAVEILRPIIERGEGEAASAARRLAGRALVRAERWDEALAMLVDDESVAGRWDRIIALAEVGRPDEAFELAAPRIMLADSSADWDRLVRITAARSPDAVDRLLSELGTMRNASDGDRARWLLAAAQGAVGHDDRGATRRLEQVAGMPDVPSASSARILLVERRVAAVEDSATLATTLAAIGGVVRGDAAAGVLAERLARWGRRIQDDLVGTPPGVPEGDLAMFYQAGIARDTLGAPRLASWLLARLERGWPDSPYLPKALAARIAMEPDSVDALRARLLGVGASPYLAYLRGRDDPRFAVLEDSLGFYIDGRLAELAGGGAQGIN
jgi:tetratricopeptide (TPR) repeat protein